MTSNSLITTLVERLLGWTVTPDRFLTGDRGWLPRWRFQPCRSLEDAFRLLEAANTKEYVIRGRGPDEFWVRVRLRTGDVGEARDTSKPRAITYAIARALGLEVEKSL
jgi:hypothetical protein